MKTKKQVLRGIADRAVRDRDEARLIAGLFYTAATGKEPHAGQQVREMEAEIAEVRRKALSFDRLMAAGSGPADVTVEGARAMEGCKPEVDLAQGAATEAAPAPVNEMPEPEAAPEAAQVNEVPEAEAEPEAHVEDATFAAPSGDQGAVPADEDAPEGAPDDEGLRPRRLTRISLVSWALTGRPGQPGRPSGRGE